MDKPIIPHSPSNAKTQAVPWKDLPLTNSRVRESGDGASRLRSTEFRNQPLRSSHTSSQWWLNPTVGQITCNDSSMTRRRVQVRCRADYLATTGQTEYNEG
jgi:hypothetical protein